MTFVKYMKIKHLGSPEIKGLLGEPGKVVIQEKVDGSNVAFYVEGDIIHFSRRTSNMTDSEIIEKKKDKTTKWKFIEPVLNAFKDHPYAFNSKLYYFGESMQKHVVAYDNIPGFVGFDVLDLETHEFLYWKDARAEFELLGLPFIHVYEEKEATEVTINFLKELMKKSAYRDGQAEGVVIKRYDFKNYYGRLVFGKLVGEGFYEAKERPGNDKVLHSKDEIKIANYYATPARIEKRIFNLIDEGHILDMSMMKILFKEVTSDILEENILDIYTDYKVVDFKRLDSLVSKKCVKVLRNVMEREI